MLQLSLLRTAAGSGLGCKGPRDPAQGSVGAPSGLGRGILAGSAVEVAWRLPCVEGIGMLQRYAPARPPGARGPRRVVDVPSASRPMPASVPSLRLLRLSAVIAIMVAALV